MANNATINNSGPAASGPRTEFRISLDRVVNNSMATVNMYECVICKGLAWDPTSLYHCGHLYCRECISSYVLSKGDLEYFPCPTCRKLFVPHDDYVRNYHSRAVIETFQIECINKKNGCKFIGAYSVIEDHEFACGLDDNDWIICPTCLDEIEVKEKSKHDCCESISTKVEELKEITTRHETAIGHQSERTNGVMIRMAQMALRFIHDRKRIEHLEMSIVELGKKRKAEEMDYSDDCLGICRYCRASIHINVLHQHQKNCRSRASPPTLAILENLEIAPEMEVQSEVEIQSQAGAVIDRIEGYLSRAESDPEIQLLN